MMERERGRGRGGDGGGELLLMAGYCIYVLCTGDAGTGWDGMR